MIFKFFRKMMRAAMGTLRPSQSLRWTREGMGYFVVWLLLMATGLYQQINLILLIAGLAAGPIVGSIFVSSAMLRGLRVSRRSPRYVFSGEPLTLDYTLENTRRWSDALALVTRDALVPVEPSAPGAVERHSAVFFPRIPCQDRRRESWKTTAPARGRYRFTSVDLVTRSPFGLLERWETVDCPGELLVYPTVGTLTRRWRMIHRESTETRRGQRHDRSTQQLEYHGLRDYRSGDSLRWIHWRTTARLGEPMVKEFEQQQEQDVAVLLDPWLPRSKATAAQRDAVEQVIQFAATVCMDICRNQGRRLLLGWTGPTPGLRHGPASVKLLHELLESLALLRATHEGEVSSLFDSLPPAILREAFLVIVSTRPVNLAEEAERSTRLSEAGSLRMSSRVVLLDASRGELNDLVSYGEDAAPDRGSDRIPSKPVGSGLAPSSPIETKTDQGAWESQDGPPTLPVVGPNGSEVR